MRKEEVEGSVTAGGRRKRKAGNRMKEEKQ